MISFTNSWVRLPDRSLHLMKTGASVDNNDLRAAVFDCLGWGTDVSDWKRTRFNEIDELKFITIIASDL